MIERDADIAILGSGFAGSLMALVLNRQGLRPIVVDRAAHPRFAIGESSTPVADMILRDLADRYDLPRVRPLTRYGTWKKAYPNVGVGRKRGFSYFGHVEGRTFAPRRDHASELLVAASSEDVLSDTHWLRADVDGFLAQEVLREGIPLLEGVKITSISRPDAWRIDARRGGEEMAIRADFLIDATGAGGVTSKALDIPTGPRTLRTHSRSIYSHFQGVRLWDELYQSAGGSTGDHPYDCDAAALHHVLDEAWMWVLRFDGGLVSAGLVIDARRHPVEACSPEEEWAMWMARYPSLAEQFAGARIAAPPGRLIRTGSLQRRASRIAGEDWAMLPHTAGFIDPLHSTGIAHSLSGVERLAGILPRYWKQPELRPALRAYENAIHTELDYIDVLVANCYASMKDFRLFTTSTMIYFASAIRYERLRSECARDARTRPPSDYDGVAPDKRECDDGGWDCEDGGQAPAGLFLCAGDTDLRNLAAAAEERLRRDVDPAEYEALIERGIRPYNTAGLFAPATANMYHHTAARV